MRPPFFYLYIFNALKMLKMCTFAPVLKSKVKNTLLYETESTPYDS